MDNFRAIYEEDCELIDVCDSLDNVYKLCTKGALIGNRCRPAEKAIIKLLHSINLKLDNLLKK
ncbi:hypothetical protein ULO1_11250 [Carboxydocella sp. ULO1]|nr:hypothetical protein ULO1_11250 [Carboxydocella sp. ULO1]